MSLFTISLSGKPTLTVLLTLLPKNCVCYLVSDILFWRSSTHNILSCTYYVSNYVSDVWDGCSDIKKLVSVHKRAVKVFRAAPQTLPGRGHSSADPLPLKQHLQYDKCIFVHKNVRNKSPAYLKQPPHSGTRGNVNSSRFFLFFLKQELAPIKWVSLILSHTAGICYPVISETHVQLIHLNIRFSSISVVIVTRANRMVKHCTSL